MQSFDTNHTTAPATVWNTYDTIRRRESARLAQLHGTGITASALRHWSSLTPATQAEIRAALGLA